MAVKPIPDGYHTATPYLIVDGGVKALEYYKKAFGAEELFRMDAPGGKIGHAEFQIGNSRIMMADEHPEMGHRGPLARGGTSVAIMLYVSDCDAMYKRAIQAGGKEVKPLQDQFYGDRSGTLTDPFGHMWTVATHKEDLSPEEIGKRHDEFVRKMQKK
jgi:PhnB protein